jgi:hypothetical protein
MLLGAQGRESELPLNTGTDETEAYPQVIHSCLSNAPIRRLNEGLQKLVALS